MIIAGSFHGTLAIGALAVVELAAKEPVVDPPPGFEALDERRYGVTRLVILRWPGL